MDLIVNKISMIEILKKLVNAVLAHGNLKWGF